MSQGRLDQARGDLRAAEHLLDIEEEDYFAAEKHLKACLVRHQLPFLKTHDIQELLQPAAVPDPAVEAELASAAVLTPFPVE